MKEANNKLREKHMNTGFGFKEIDRSKPKPK